jgi:hypothetical protein
MKGGSIRRDMLFASVPDSSIAIAALPDLIEHPGR